MAIKLVLIAIIFFSLLTCHTDKIIDLSWVVPNSKNNDLYKFYIPKNFKPMYGKLDKVFNFSVELPSEGLPFQEIGTDAQNVVRVTVGAVDSKQRMIASETLKKIQSVSNDKKHPIQYKFIDKIGDFYKYKHYHFSDTYYIKKDKNGEVIVIYENADPLNGFMAYRQLNDNIEISYNYSKKISVKEWHILDRYILEIVHSFQFLYQKKCSNKSNIMCV